MTRDRGEQSRQQKQDQIYADGASSIISDLEEEVNILLAQKADHGDKLVSVLDKLSSESAVRTKLEARIKLLETQAGSAEELRREAVITVHARKRICCAIEEIRARFDAVTAERDAFAKKVASTNGSRRKIHDIKAKVRRLRIQIKDVSRLSDKLTKVEQERSILDKKVHDVMRRLVESQNLSNTMKLNLDATRQVVRDMYSQSETSDSQIQLLRKELEDAGAKLDRTQKELASQTAANKQMEIKLKMLTEDYETVYADRDTASEMYRDLREGAMRVLERTRVGEHDNTRQELSYVNSYAAK